MSLLERLKHPYVPALIFLFLYLSPNLFFASHARYLIHDNLNSNVVWAKILFDSGTLFASNHALIPNICWGIPRGVMESQLNVGILLYAVFSPLVAYNLNIIIMHLIAFMGMYLLLSRYVFKYSYPFYYCAIALSFALLPFWPSGGLSVAGQPLVVWAMLNILHKHYSLKNWLIICLFPFYSSIVLNNLFFACGLLLVVSVNSIINRQINYKGLLAWLVFIIAMLTPEYRLFYMQFIDKITSSRSTYFQFLLNMKGVMGESSKLFLKGQYHFYSFQWPIIILSSFIALLVIKNVTKRVVLLLFLLCAYTCAFLDVLHKSVIILPLLNLFGQLKYVQFRFICMLPLLWHIIFAFSILFIISRFPKTKKALLGLVVINIGFTVFNLFPNDCSESNFVENAFYYTFINHTNDGDHATFNDYYSPDLFAMAKKKMGYDNHQTICLGFQSEIAQYSDIYTVTSASSYLPDDKAKKAHNIFGPTIITHGVSDYYHYDSAAIIKAINYQNDTAIWRKQPIGYILSVYPIDNFNSVGLDSIGYVPNQDKGIINGLYLFKFKKKI
jgi:hypothetical protein